MAVMVRSRQRANEAGTVIVPLTGAVHTLQPIDRNCILTFNSAAAVTVTVPNNLPAGFECWLLQEGAGTISVVAGAGATLNSPGGPPYQTSAQFATLDCLVMDNADGVSANWDILSPGGGGGGSPGSGTVTSVALVAPAEFTVTGSPVTSAGALTLAKASQPQHAVWAAPAGAAGVPTFRVLQPTDVPALSYVTSVGLAMPAAIFTVTNSPIIAAGNLTVAMASQAPGLVLASPPGVAGPPSFRAIALVDLPNGVVTSVGLAVPPEFFVSGSPVTDTGTLTFGKSVQAANLVYVGPNTGGNAAPTFRLLTGNDMPNPGPASQGGVQSFAAVAHQFLTGITTLGAPVAAQPAAADISGLGSFATQNFATPPIIGGTTPNVGNFTALNGQTLTVTDPAAAPVSTFLLTATGGNGSNIKMVGDGATAPSKTIRVKGGQYQIVNDAYTLAILTLTDAGALTAPSVNATSAGTPAAPSLLVGPAASGIGLYSATQLLGFSNSATATQPVNLVGNSSLVFGATAQVRIGLANTNLAALQILGGNTYAGLNISRWDNSNTFPILSFGKSRSTTVGTPGGAVTSGTNLGSIQFAADDGTTINTVAAQIWAQCNGAVSTGVVPTALVFTTQQGANDFCMSAGSLYAGGSVAGKLLLDGVYSYANPAPTWQRLASVNNFNVVASNGMGGIMFTPAGTLATGAITMPNAPVDQQEWGLASSTAITALTMNAAAGQTLLGALTTLAANGFARWKYFLATTTWYRVG